MRSLEIWNSELEILRMDVRIVIVSWNVEQLLDRCLASLPAGCDGLSWDVVVVDNASRDGSAEVARRHGAVVIVNKDNRGFAKACNQGMAGSDARYVLLLNPDTECPLGSLVALVRAADANPKAGIIGPKLLNADGSTQTSIRRFPDVWSQAGIMLKLHHLRAGAAGSGVFARYFASDLSLDTEQDVDQVMGSCFLIRRALIERIGGLDERYFIWFEEVDYCRQAIAAGWSVRYVPSVLVMHHGGQSFGQVFSLKKQRYFNNSLLAYFQKWHPSWQARFLLMLQPLSLALAWAAGRLGVGGAGGRMALSAVRKAQRGNMADASRISRRSLIGWAAIILALETFSALTIFRDTANAVTCLAIAGIIGWVAYRRPTLALGFLALELFIGSKGQLLQVWGWPGVASLRVLIFAAFLIGWAGNVLATTDAFKRMKAVGRTLIRERWEWVLLGVVLVHAFARGVVLGNGPIIADGNAWIFLLLLFPVLDLARREGSGLVRAVLPVLIVAPIWLAVKTLGLEYIFSHGFPSVSPQLYLWVRRTGVGEVTLVTANAFRIFMQSYIFALPVIFFGASYYFATHETGFFGRLSLAKKGTAAVRGWDLLLFSALTVLAISLSRSMWIGAAVGLCVLAGLYLRNGHMEALKKILRTALRMLAIGAVALAMLFVVLAFPVPRVDVASLAGLFGSRASTSDPAAASRWNLLTVVERKIREHPILGSGFGATVTYHTQDPRILAKNPTGAYTTYAFEWGWLEHWVKFGLFGFVLMIVLVWRLGGRLLRMDAPDWIRFGAIASLAGLAATHVFTPYLNHPLGLGYLLALEALTLLNAKGAQHGRMSIR